MRTPVKLTVFASAVAVVFAGALAVGATTGSPIEPGTTTPHGADHNAAHSARQADTADTDAAAGGLVVADRGYALKLADPVLPADGTAVVAFAITGEDGEPVTDFEITHDKEMHLILVRRDGTGFQHLHPTMAPEGTWSAEAELTPGAWRVFADFAPAAGPGAGEALTLGADLSVAGAYDPEPVPAPSRTASVDGYDLTLDGELTPGRDSALTVSVSRDGEPVDDLQPYLGAYGHLVALRAGDLAYLHVHPDSGAGDGSTPAGPDITFHATAPSIGTYLLYLDFQHDGEVRTAAFTIAAGTPSSNKTLPTSPGVPADHGDRDGYGGSGHDGHSH